MVGPLQSTKRQSAEESPSSWDQALGGVVPSQETPPSASHLLVCNRGRWDWSTIPGHYHCRCLHDIALDGRHACECQGCQFLAEASRHRSCRIQGFVQRSGFWTGKIRICEYSNIRISSLTHTCYNNSTGTSIAVPSKRVLCAFLVGANAHERLKVDPSLPLLAPPLRPPSALSIHQSPRP